MLPGVEMCGNAYAPWMVPMQLSRSEWNEFRALDLSGVKGLLKQPVMVDLRNVYNPDEMAAAGFSYVCVGRNTLKSKGLDVISHKFLPTILREYDVRGRYWRDSVR